MDIHISKNDPIFPIFFSGTKFHIFSGKCLFYTKTCDLSILFMQ